MREKVRRNRMRNCFDVWRQDHCADFKQREADMEPIYRQKRQEKMTHHLDDQIETLNAYLEQLITEVKEEVKAKEHLIQLYQENMD